MLRVLIVLTLFLFACSSVNESKQELSSIIQDDLDSNSFNRTGTPLVISRSDKDFKQIGTAEIYLDEKHGKLTASGKTFNIRELVAAHPSLPFGTHILVKNLTNEKSVVVEIVDRGPFSQGPIIGLSFEAAKELQILQKENVLLQITIKNSKR